MLKQNLNTLISNSYKSALSKDVIFSLFIRGINTFINLILLPLSLKILTSADYGIWLTVSGLYAWVSLFDFGTQNTLRNALTITTKDDRSQDRIKGMLLTNSFGFTLILSVFFIILSLVFYFACDFSTLLKIHQSNKKDINMLVLMSLMIFGIKLFSNNYNAILMSLQKAYMTIIINLSANLIIIIWLALGYFNKVHFSVLQYGLVVLLIDIFISVLFPLLYLKVINYRYNISYKYISFKYFKKNLLKNNLKFFSLSVLVVLTFFSTNIFIGTMLSYQAVTEYNLVNKYFNIITVISVVALNPIWTKVAINFNEKNFDGIQLLFKKTTYYIFAFVLLGGVLLYFDRAFYSVFGTKQIVIGKFVSTVALLSMLQLFYNNIHAYFLNGMNALYMQIIGFAIAAIIIYPCYYYFCNYLKMGVLGAFWVQIIVYIPNTILFPLALKHQIKLGLKK
jgi:O-antigen/teichoic acid export membrane protein